MRICDTTTSTIRIQRATKQLNEAWRDTKEHWTDKNRDEFEKKYLLALGSLASSTVVAVQRITKILEQAEKECGDND